MTLAFTMTTDENVLNISQILFAVIARSGLVGHSYADDTQVYISAAATSAIGIDHCSALRFVRTAGMPG